MPYFVYILRCGDGTLYTGVTTDMTRRLHEHNHTTRGAKYTATRRPVSLVFQEQLSDKSTALKREYSVRHLSRADKLELIVKNAKMN